MDSFILFASSYIMAQMQIECISPRSTQETSETVRQHDAIHRIGNVVDFFSSNGLDVRVIGSIGRTLSTLSKLPDMQRLDSPTVHYRDIDLMVIGGQKDKMHSLTMLKTAREIAYPFPVEIHIKHMKSEGKRTLIYYRELEYEVFPEVFEKRDVDLDGRRIPTLDPNTLFHLSALHIRLRPKDFRSLLSYGRLIRSRDNVLPEELFEPFHRLMKEGCELYPLDIGIIQLKDFYVNNCPTLLKKCVNFPLRKANAIYFKKDL